jgi:hypothetical protein
MNKSKDDLLKQLKAEYFDLRKMIEALEDREVELLEEVERLEHDDCPEMRVYEYANIYLN